MTVWREVKLNQVCQLIMGQSPKSIYYNQEENGLPFLQGCAEFQEINPKTDIYCSLPNKIAPVNSLLFSVRAPVGKMNIADQKYCIGRGIAALVAKEVDPDFLYYVLHTKAHYFSGLAQGSTFTAINSDQLANLIFFVPDSKKDQQTIARVLLLIDSAIAKQQQLLAKQQRIKTGLMQDLLTKGIDEKGNIRSEATHTFKDSPLGRIPEEWEVSNISKSSIEVVDCPHSTPVFAEEGNLVARTFNIKNGQFNHSTASFVNDHEYKYRISRLEPRAGDIIFTREAPVGEAFTISEGMKICLGQRVMLIRPKKHEYLPEFLVTFFYSSIAKQMFDQICAGTTTPHLNVADVKNIKFPKPLINEQNKIMIAINNTTKQANSIKDKLIKMGKIKKGLMQDLLTDKKDISHLDFDSLPDTLTH